MKNFIVFTAQFPNDFGNIEKIADVDDLFEAIPILDSLRNDGFTTLQSIDNFLGYVFDQQTNDLHAIISGQPQVNPISDDQISTIRHRLEVS